VVSTTTLTSVGAQVEHMMNEKSILSNLTHAFIVKMAGTFQDDRFDIFFSSFFPPL
jgi:hypothetical protein